MAIVAAFATKKGDEWSLCKEMVWLMTDNFCIAYVNTVVKEFASLRL